MKGRSKVSNGTRLLAADIDGRSSHARRFRDLVRAFTAELGGTLSELERGLVRQAAAIVLKTEQMQEELVRGKSVDTDELIRLSSESRRVLAAITGTGRKQRHHNTRDNARASAPRSIEDLIAP
jgi:hypothetical protein